MEARQDQKNLTAGHKRQLQLLREDLETTRDKDNKARDESYRQVRSKRRGVEKELKEINMDLSEVIAEKNKLAKVVNRRTLMVEGLRELGLAWQGRHDELQGKMKGTGERLTFVEGALVHQTRQIAALERKQDQLVENVVERDNVIAERDNVIAAHATILGEMRGKHEGKYTRQRHKRQFLLDAGITARKEAVKAKAAEKVWARFRDKTRHDKTRQDKKRQD
jgi:hypothetical protein